MSIGVKKLYLLDVGHHQAILLPDEDGVPTRSEPQPAVTRAAYLNTVERTDLDSAQTQISAGRMLLYQVPCPDGPPRRSVFCFTLLARSEAPGGACQ